MRPRSLLAIALFLAAGPALAAETITWTCYRNAAFTALATENVESVGTRFITRKSTDSIAADCMIETRPSDRVLGENRPGSDDMNAFYYSMLHENFLILDDGTGTSRTLVIFDLATGRKAFSGGYSVVQGTTDACEPKSQCGLPDEFAYDEAGLSFWRITGEAATAKTCANYARLKAAGKPVGMEPMVAEKSLFTFATASVSSLQARRCVLRD
jgi:hypothetical protein